MSPRAPPPHPTPPAGRIRAPRFPPGKGPGPGVSSTKYSRRAQAVRSELSYLYPEPAPPPHRAASWRCPAPEGRSTEGRPEEPGKSRSHNPGPRAQRGCGWLPGLLSEGRRRWGARMCPACPRTRRVKGKKRGPPGRPQAGRRLSTGAAGRLPVPEPRSIGPCLPAAARSPRASARLAARRRAGGDSVLRPLARHFPSARHRCLAPPRRDPAGGATQCSPTAQTAARAEPSRRISPAAPRPQTGPPTSPTPGAELGALARSPLPPLRLPLCTLSPLSAGAGTQRDWVPRSPRHRPLSPPAPGGRSL